MKLRLKRVLLRQNIVSAITIAACEQAKKYGGSWLCLTFKNWRKMSGYMGHHTFVGLGLSPLVPKADCCVIAGIYTGLEKHVVIATISQASLNAQIVKLFGGTVFIIILEIILNIQERQPASASSTARNLESPMHPASKNLQSLYTIIVLIPSFSSG
jgi:hypothetical protein